MFGLITKKKFDAKINEQNSMLLKAMSFPFNTIGGTPLYQYNSIEGTDQYCSVDDLYSIVKRITKTAKRIPLYVYAVKDERKHAQYKLLARQFDKTKKGWDNVMELKDASMEIIGDNDELQKKLDNPNEIYTKDEFLEGCYAYMLLSGNRYIWKEMLPSGANAGKPYDIWILPSNFMNMRIERGFPPKVTGYELNAMPTRKNFNTDEIIHSRYFNPRYDVSGSELIGLSPVQAMYKTITQSGAERDYTNQALQNAGAYGAFTAPLTGEKAIETAGRMKADFYKEAGAAWKDGTNLNAKKIAFLAGDWKYTQFGFSPADMEIIAQNKVTFQKMCNVYGLSDILFNNDTAATESNVKEMIMQMYTNAVLPEVHSLRDALNKELTPLYKDKKRHIDYDITDIAEMQEDAANIVARFANAPAFRINDMYEALGFGRTDDPAADVILVKQGYSPLDDIATSIQDLAITGDYNQGN